MPQKGSIPKWNFSHKSLWKHVVEKNRTFLLSFFSSLCSYVWQNFIFLFFFCACWKYHNCDILHRKSFWIMHLGEKKTWTVFVVFVYIQPFFTSKRELLRLPGFGYQLWWQLWFVSFFSAFGFEDSGRYIRTKPKSYFERIIQNTCDLWVLVIKLDAVETCIWFV